MPADTRNAIVKLNCQRSKPRAHMA